MRPSLKHVFMRSFGPAVLIVALNTGERNISQIFWEQCYTYEQPSYILIIGVSKYFTSVSAVSFCEHNFGTEEVYKVYPEFIDAFLVSTEVHLFFVGMNWPKRFSAYA